MKVGSGEIVAVLGGNGAGKSTLLKAIVGLLTTMSGKVLLDGEDVAEVSAEQRARKGVGYVPQSRDVFEALSVSENLEMGGYLLPRSQLVERIRRIYEFFPPLAQMSGRVAGKLSGGERKMLAVGRALMQDPKVLVLDEPTAGLTEEFAAMLLEQYITGLAAAGCAVLLVEQRAMAALKVSDWAYVMVTGAITVSAPGPVVGARDDIGEALLGVRSQ